MTSSNGHHARILVVDDEDLNGQLLRRVLGRAGYEDVEVVAHAPDAPSTFETTSPDLVLLDLNMPGLDGFAIMRRLKQLIAEDDYVPIVVITGDLSFEARHRALTEGATDFLTKPFDETEIAARVRNLLQTRGLHQRLRDQKSALEETVEQRTVDLTRAVSDLESYQRELRLSREETVYRLCLAAEFRDDDTGSHIKRMGRYCEVLARRVGMGAEQQELMRLASELHDVGKIATPDRILLKPAPLTPTERQIMEQHAAIGYRILAGSESELMRLAASVALTHHEKFDGTGYPQCMKGGEIPLEGRIAAVADVFDALTTDRVYRQALPLNQAVDIMSRGRGAHFDPELLDLFLSDLAELVEIMEDLGDDIDLTSPARRISLGS